MIESESSSSAEEMLPIPQREASPPAPIREFDLLSLALLLAILALAAYLRFYGLRWDNTQGLHPDERFLTMVTNDCKLPATFSDYLDPVRSTLNPYNCNFHFFVYGTLPINLTKFLIGYFIQDHYGNIFIFGRILSALFDLSTVLAVFLIASLFRSRYTLSNSFPAWAALAYALMVLPIQQSHFYTTDTFSTAFFAWSLYLALRYSWGLQPRERS